MKSQLTILTGAIVCVIALGFLALVLPAAPHFLCARLLASR